MDGKLQEKFALVQQMKREKELKEARARESQPFDIFAIAGVTLPGGGSSGGLNMTIRHDGGPTTGSIKRSRKDTIHKTHEESGDITRQRSAIIGDLAGPKTKLKRSSLAAVRGERQEAAAAVSTAMEDTAQSSETVVPITADNQQSLSAVTPPTPIPSPKADDNIAPRRNSGSASPTKLLAKDMTHNVQSRSGSVDENEEMVVDMFGRSVPRSRHHSSDEGSDSENESARGGSGGGGVRRAGDRDRDRERDRYYSGDETHPPTTNPAEEADPFLAASRYLDTAFYPTKIYVGNLPSSISLTSLRTLFAPFGDIEDMNLVEGKDFGFVTYVEPVAAQQALGKMNGAVLDGTSIRVNRAKIPERNRHGFAGVAWMDEDGELARLEEEQHQQAAAMTGAFVARSPSSMSSSRPMMSGGGETPHGGSASGSREQSYSPSSTVVPPRSAHQPPSHPRSPKLPPKPTGAALFPPAGIDPRATMASAVRGSGRQILRYDDL
ncbi:hypothetical protein BGZ98_000711 [Dissophora globulifera]|nr:hypothetical protein BGZ98_000711 [Dissophora globulifera]